MRKSTCAKGLCLLLLTSLTLTSRAEAQDEMVDFDSDRWQLVNAQITNHLGRECLMGTAILQDVEFENGVIEVDIAVDGSRSYPGIVFRMQSNKHHERFYVRPHRAGLYPDALQYTPVINGVAGWQLYNGEGFTAAANIPAGEWIHMKLEVSGSQARVYLGGSEEPGLLIHELKHGASKGAIGVLGPDDGSACFSNFRYRLDDNLEFDRVGPVEEAPGIVTQWDISRPYKAERVNRDRYPSFYAIFGANWQAVAAEPTGLVDLARYAERSEGGSDLVLARTKVYSDRKQDVTFSFGYSDEIDLFLNGRKVFAANSSYQHRDPSFLGIVGLNDAITMPLERGINEIFAMVTETFGGWGLMGRFDEELDLPVKEHHRTNLIWQTPDVLLTPETVLWDPQRHVLYVSNFDVRFQATEDRTGYISKLDLDGEIQEQQWITDLDAPTGMAVHGDRLYVVERGFLAEIDIGRGEVIARYELPGAVFPNDVVVDQDGSIYVSDTSPNGKIFRLEDGDVEVWLTGEEVNRVNGLFIHDGELLMGSSGDGFLKAVNLSDKSVRNVVCLGAGIIDGIRVTEEGNYLVSHWGGQVYEVSPSGEVVELLDTMGQKLNVADFEFLPDRNLLLAPTYMGNRVSAYSVRP